MHSARLARFFFNLWPPLYFTGIRFTHIDQHWRNIRVEMPLRFYNKNNLGMHFGGSLYSMIDPLYVMMITNNLSTNYFVVDHSASIHYKKPGLGRVYAECSLSEAELNDIKQQLMIQEKYLKTFFIEIKNQQHDVVCEIEKTIYIRKKV